MNKAKLALAAAGVAALVGGGTAIAAKGHNHQRAGGPPLLAMGAMRHAGGALQPAAGYLGTTPGALLAQLRAGKTLAQIADATSGKSAQGLIDALVGAAKTKLGSTAPADLTQRVTDLVNGVHGLRGRLGSLRGLHGGPFGLRAAATYLGVSADSLLTQLRSGKTLAQIANATPGKSAQGLIDALTADARQNITDFVNGKTP